MPTGTPPFLIPYIYFIEIISFLSKGFSLGIRLAANMFAGHVLLHIIAEGSIFFFVYSLYSIIIFFIILILLSIFMILEMLIAFLQGYVFIILSIIYFDDMIKEEH